VLLLFLKVQASTVVTSIVNHLLSVFSLLCLLMCLLRRNPIIGAGGQTGQAADSVMYRSLNLCSIY
jgi:hypothetical protein